MHTVWSLLLCLGLCLFLYALSLNFKSIFRRAKNSHDPFSYLVGAGLMDIHEYSKKEKSEFIRSNFLIVSSLFLVFISLSFMMVPEAGTMTQFSHSFPLIPVLSYFH